MVAWLAFSPVPHASALRIDPQLSRPLRRRALSTRELLEMLAARGADCRVLTAGVLDYERETTLDEVLAGLDLTSQRFQADLGLGGLAEVIDLAVNGVRVTLMPTASSRAERSPDMRESACFLNLADQVLERFRPDILLTYGGHPACLELMRRARMRSVAVVFHLHNFGYNDRRAFADASAIIFPSEYSRRYHARTLGLDGPVIPDPIPLDRVVADNPEPKYVTFINPQPAKGLTVFARIAMELNQRRPDIPFLVVEGRGTSESLAQASGRSFGPDEPAPHGHHAGPARLLPREPRGPGAIPVARIVGPGADGSDGQRHPRPGQRPGRIA